METSTPETGAMRRSDPVQFRAASGSATACCEACFNQQVAPCCGESVSGLVQAKLDRVFGTRVFASRIAVQRVASAAPHSPQQDVSEGTAVQAHERAQSAIRGPSGPLPHLDQIQRAFGQHDLTGISAHTDAAAQTGARAFGAEAFTTGSHVAFARTPSLHTAAHEAAHVLQQRQGVQLTGGLGQVGDRYEQHADAVADQVVAGRSAESLLDSFFGRKRTVPASASASVQRKSAVQPTEGKTQPILLKPTIQEKKEKKREKAKEEQNAKEEVRPDFRKAIITKPTRTMETPAGRALVFKVGIPFPLPREKANVFSVWKAKADAGALEVAWSLDKKRLDLKQVRDKTDELRSYWLQKVGWNGRTESPQSLWNKLRDDYDKNYKAQEAEASSDWRPRASSGVCHMDHIVELQTQGTNVGSNIQVLDAQANVDSGRKIHRDLSAIAEEFVNVVPQDVVVLILHFDKVKVMGEDAKLGPCCEIEAAAMRGEPKPTGKEKKARQDSQPDTRTISAGGLTATILIPTHGKREQAVDLKDSKEFPENANAAQLIPGLLLTHYKQTKTPQGDHVLAILDDRDRTRIPITLAGEKGSQKEGGFKLTIDSKGKLKLSPEQRLLKFHYPYLSEGSIKTLSIDDHGFSGVGQIRPSVPLLSGMTLDVRFGPDILEITKGVEPNRLKLPIPFVKLTKASLSLRLHPEFLPVGEVEFEAGRSATSRLVGALTLSADADGLCAQGDVRVTLPGVENATGTIRYQRRSLSGAIHIDAAQFKLPSKSITVRKGSVDVQLVDNRLYAEGTLVLGLPRGQEAEISLVYSKDSWIFKGKGTFRIPPLKDFQAWVVYDGKDIKAGGSTSVSYRGFTAQVDVSYVNGKVSGTGTLNFKKGRVTGAAKVHIDDELNLFGDGDVQVAISEELLAKAGIELKKGGGVHVTGALTISKPIVLFSRFGQKFEIFSVQKSFPVPALSLGPLGVQASIGASLDAEYGIGPAQLVGTTISLALNPFDDKPDAEVGLKTSLELPAFAAISASISGGLELEAGIGRAGGQITITGGARLSGGAGGDFSATYKNKQLTVDANAVISANLALLLGIKATLYGELGVWRFKKRWTKTWELYNRLFDTGLGFKLRAPVSYSTVGGAKLPSLSQIEVSKPNLDAVSLIDRLASSAQSNEVERDS